MTHAQLLLASPIAARRRGRKFRGLIGASVVLSLMLGGCGGKPEPKKPDAKPEAKTTETSELASVTRTATLQGQDVSVEYGPLVVDGDYGYLRVHVTPESGSASTLGGMFNYTTSGGGETAPIGSAVQVYDLERGNAHIPVSFSALSDYEIGDPAKPYFVKVEAGDLKPGDDVEVLHNEMGMVTVPVLAPGDPGAFELTDQATLAGGGQHTWNGTAVVPIGTTRQAWDKSTENAESAEGEKLTLSSDVLFAVDSSDLSPEASTMLDRAAKQLNGYTGGQVAIVGHTDHVADDAYNQALSERRAASVHAALGERIDMARFEVSVEGRGETEPRVEGTSEEAKAANRRVEITITASADQRKTSKPTPSSAATPAPVGEVATGAEVVTLTDSMSQGTAVLRVPEVRRIGGYLVGEMTATRTNDGGNNLSFFPYLFMGSARPTGIELYSLTNDAGMSVLDGDQLERNAYYDIPEVGGFLLIDRNKRFSPEAKDQTQRLTFVWADTGQDTVTLSSEQNQNKPPFRLTDIPVVDGPAYSVTNGAKDAPNAKKR